MYRCTNINEFFYFAASVHILCGLLNITRLKILSVSRRQDLKRKKYSQWVEKILDKISYTIK